MGCFAMKTVVAVQGAFNSGKTSSIKAALARLIERFPSAKCRYLKEGADIIVVIDIGGIVIIICSWGDNAEALKKLMDMVRDCDWSVLVCAMRTRGGTVDYIHELCNKNRAALEIVEKGRALSPSVRQGENNITADKIVEVVAVAAGLS